MFPYGKHKLRWLVEGSSLPAGEQAHSLEGRRAGAEPPAPWGAVRAGGHAQTPVLPGLPIWPSCARGWGSFSPSLVPLQPVSGGLLGASLAQGCGFDLQTEEPPRPEKGGEGVCGGCACGVMEDCPVKPSLPAGSRDPLGSRHHPGTSLHTGAHTRHPALTAKIGQG